MTLLRDSLPEPDPIRVSVFSSPVIDAVVAFWAHVVETSELESFEKAARIRDLVGSVDLGEDGEWMAASHAQRWSFLVAHIVASEAQTIDGLIEHVREMEPSMLQRTLETHLADECPDGCKMEHLDLGDPAEEQDRLARVLETVDAAIGPQLATLSAMLEHDANLTKFLVRRMPLEQLIETVTNGIAYRPQAGVRRIVLIPSLLIRPWNLMFGFSDTQYFLYPMSDEASEADRDTPPSWMVQMFKALGDERRLRLMRRLGEGASGLAELADHLELAKSTTHHHLRTLRAAGLVRAVVDGDKKEDTKYELRRDLLPEAVRFVGNYLDGTREGESQ